MPNKWEKIDALTTKAPDGSKAWLDIRGCVGLQQPNGYIVTLGASFADK